MSVSQFKSFGKCQAAALAELKGRYQREQTTALLVGSYVDSYFEGDNESLSKQKPGDFLSVMERSRRNTYKQTPLSKRIEQDKLFFSYLSGQKQVIMTGEIKGVPIKIKIDSLHCDKIVDLKIMEGFRLSL